MCQPSIHTIHGAPFHPYQSSTSHESFFGDVSSWASATVPPPDFSCGCDDGLDGRGRRVAPREKFTTIYSGMNVEPFTQAKQHRAAVRQEYGFGDEHVVIGKIARLFHLKGHQDLINAAVPVVKSQPNVRFLLVGDGVLRESLTQQINELGLSKHFVFAGLVPPSEVPKLIGGMDALVHASYREGLARALPQALIAGLPVISYDVDGAREVTITGKTGILVPAQDVSALSQALGTMAGDRDLRKQLGAEGQRRFTEQFDHRTMTARVRELYQEQIAEK